MMVRRTHITMEMDGLTRLSAVYKLMHELWLWGYDDSHLLTIILTIKQSFLYG